LKASLARAALFAAAGAAAGLLAGGVEAAHLSVVARRFFLSARELRAAVLSVLGIEAGLGVLAGLAVGVVALLAAGVGRRVAKDPVRGAGAVVGLLVAPVVGWSLWELTAGPQARRLPGRAALVALLALGVGVAIAWLTPRVVRRVDGSAGRIRLGFAAVLVGLGAGLVVADARVLPRLYPVFHAWLGALAFAAMLGAVWLVGAPTRLARGRWSILPVVLAVVAVLQGAHATDALLATQNARSVLSERAPAVGRALRAMARLGIRPPSAVERMVTLTPELERELAPQQAETAGLPALDVSNRDLLLVTIDALRPDHLGVYGYERATSPSLDALARDAVVFERAYTATPQTSYAVASLLTGKYVRSLFRLDQPPSNETLAHMLRDRGMHTAGFFTDAVFFIDRERFTDFEEDRFGFEYNKMHPVDARPRLEQVREYLAGRARQDRLFVWVHFFEPHEPYVPQPAHRFGDRDVDLYDGEIAETDAAVGDLVEMMRARGREPIVVVTADHGEEFGDHGGRYHGSTLYEEQVRVPLVLRVPGIPARRVSAPVQTVDVVPTLLGLYGVPWSARVRGTDLRPLLFGRPLETRAFADGIGARMMVVGGEKLICDEEQGLCALYDLASDPRERRNLADARGPRVAELRRTLSAWAASHARFERAADVAAGQGDWPEAIRRAQLGDEGARVEAIALLRGSPDARVRAKAAEVLGPLGGPEVAAALASALEDPEGAVQVMAALSLLEAGDARGAEGARRVAADAAVPAALKNRAILALGARGDPTAAPVLRALVADEAAPAETRIAAVEHLGRMHDRAVVPLFISRMREVRLELAIVRALAEIGDRRALPCLERAVVDDPYDTVRTAAAGALLALSDRGACGALRRAAAGREPVVGALEALVGLGCEEALRERAPEGWRCNDVGCVPPASGGTVRGAVGRGPSRAVASWSAAGDGGRLVLSGQPIPLVAGTHEGSVDLPAGTRSVSVALDPPDLDVSIRALVVLPIRPSGR
jgi:arylsulfatase A-like enzyme